MKKHVALAVGHQGTAQGARHEKSGLTEWQFSMQVVPAIKEILETEHNCTVSVFEGGKLKDRIHAINLEHQTTKFDVAIDSHLNADYDHTDPHDKNDSHGHGTMVMYIPHSKTRKAQADAMSASIAETLGERDLGGREGWYWGNVKAGEQPTSPDGFLRYVNCPSFVMEAGFIDNNKFYTEHLETKDKLYGVAMAMADAIVVFLENN